MIDHRQTPDLQELIDHCRAYKGAQTGRSLFQISNAVILYLGLLTLIYFSLEYSIVLALLLAIPCGGLYVRLFIIQHDCGHQSYFRNKWANDLAGRLVSLLTVTPYSAWRRAHNIHHVDSGNLDRRGVGSIDTLTVREYQQLTSKQKLFYRLYRNPFVLVLFGTPYYIILAQRWPYHANPAYLEGFTAMEDSTIARSVFTLDAALIVVYGLVASVVGLPETLLVVLPPVAIGAAIGGLLFFVQHQFEGMYWRRTKEWNYREAALYGSSYYVLPPVLQWFTGNIGFHHAHHLCPLIPNYRLQKCVDNQETLRRMNRVTLSQSLKSFRLALWDEDKNRLVPFRELETA